MNELTLGTPAPTRDHTRDHTTGFRDLPAHQQPDWPDAEALAAVLRGLPPEDLVDRASATELKARLAGLESSGAVVLQLGDCVEDIDLDVAADTADKLAFIDANRVRFGAHTGRPVVAVGRIAGQYAKPRSSSHEVVAGTLLPSYRGPIVNSPAASAEARQATPGRVATAHAAARTAAEVVRSFNRSRYRDEVVWTSHEMLLLDYELHFLREGAIDHHLATTHWPWIGARTRQLDSAHVAVAATLTNPVSVKIGPDTSPDEAVEIALALNPYDEPGKLAFIVRMGHESIHLLRPIARRVRQRVRNLHWITDPMHGNTVKAAGGLKTRHLDHVISEVRHFQRILLDEGLRPAGLHLEATPDDVYECADNFQDPYDTTRYTSLLDPRLNPEQTARVLDAWIA
ncbi:3-deoxy-7-phosphoheptulonate synthase [Actinosynnema sp. NPDC023587]|uniref:3-deoxy-7-phosphoheptulonate synthase n=1 Tax=Actinosynnema sp. NPDC023587 TaxID=3154695 RepID=UPI0033DD1C76